MMMRPILLDLFCKAGGASMGYYEAGFDVVGVDIEPQPNYPFEFIQDDARRFLRGNWKHFDVISASPPCQAYSSLKTLANSGHADLVPTMQKLLYRIPRAWVIENVVGAPLNRPVMLCGSMFDM